MNVNRLPAQMGALVPITWDIIRVLVVGGLPGGGVTLR